MSEKQRQASETRARQRWMAFVVGIFVSQGALWVFAISMVANDSSHAIVSDYDQRALDWDDHVRRQRESASLGWSASIDLESPSAHRDGRVLVVKLADAQAQPIADADVEVTLFHQARAAERTTLALQPDGLGRYEGVAPMNRRGKWRLELLARRGGDELVLERMHSLETEE